MLNILAQTYMIAARTEEGTTRVREVPPKSRRRRFFRLPGKARHIDPGKL